MKKFYILFAFISSLGLLASCSNDDKSKYNDSQIVGKWETTYYEWRFKDTDPNGEVDIEQGSTYPTGWTHEDYDQIEFRDDHTGQIVMYRMQYPDNNYEYEYISIRWKITGKNRLIFSYIDNGEEIETGSFSITKLTSTELIMEDSYRDREDGYIYEGYEKKIYRKLGSE